MSQPCAIESAGPDVRETTDRPSLLAGLFDAHHDRLYRLARRLSHDPEEARDLVQETFLRLARSARPVPTEGGRALLVRILVNLCRDRARRLGVRRRLTPRPFAVPAAADPESAAVARATVQSALSRLSPRRRAVIVLHELDGLPVRRVARLLGLSQVTVRWHLSAGRKALAAMLLPAEKGAGAEDAS